MPRWPNRDCGDRPQTTGASRFDPFLPPVEIIQTACDSGNKRACLHSLKLRAFKVIAENNILESRGDLMALSHDIRRTSAGSNLSRFEWEKLKQISDVVDAYLSDLPRYARQRDSDQPNEGTRELVRTLSGIELPMPSFQAERARN